MYNAGNWAMFIPYIKVVEHSTTYGVCDPVSGSYTQPVSVTSAGAAFKKALVEESPLQIIGTINANHALLAKRADFVRSTFQVEESLQDRWVFQI
jgi:hypothetical protein